MTSAGQRHDSLAFISLMERLKVARRGPGRPQTRPGRLLAGKACSSHAIRAHLRRRRIKATIPEPADQIKSRLRRGARGGRPPAFDTEAYKQRNTVERAFCRLRHRAVATRYDKRDFVYRGTVDVAAIRIWLRDLTQQDLRDTPRRFRPMAVSSGLTGTEQPVLGKRAWSAPDPGGFPAGAVELGFVPGQGGSGFSGLAIGPWPGDRAPGQGRQAAAQQGARPLGTGSSSGKGRAGADGARSPGRVAPRVRAWRASPAAKHTALR